jgi:hypothetical protein
MIRVLSRKTYRFLLYLHPPAFREQFGDEMLWIFDETAEAGSSGLPLLTDGLVSALRQWFIGYEVWKVVPLSAYWFTCLCCLIGMLLRRGLKP